MSVSSEREPLRLKDIVDNIGRIMSYVADLDEEDFGDDQKTVDAVERCLQRITEAVIKIGEERMRAISPSLPVHAVRGLGNLLRHEYDGIDYEVVWNTIMDRLPPLRDDRERALGSGA